MTTKAPEDDWNLTLIDHIIGAQIDPPSLKDQFLQLHAGLFHYTTASGLKGIIEDKCLWATAAAYLNDASEVEYGCAVLNEVLATWQKDNGGKRSLSATAVDIIGALFSDPFSRLDKATQIYVACFCTKSNLLSQWRAYGQVGGYSVGFRLFGTGFPADSNKIFGGLKPEHDHYRASLMPVIYEKEAQRAVLAEVLKRNLEALERQELKRIYESLGERTQQEFVAKAALLIEHFLMEQIVAFKNKAFEEENEWRIVARPKFGRHALSRGERDDAVHLRTARGLIVPYLKLIPASDFPIQSVTIGPTLDKARAERSLRLLLIQNDLGTSIGIDGSDIPVVV